MASALTSCEDSGTGGELVPLTVEVALVSSGAALGLDGWQIELEEASGRVAGIYLYQDPPPLVARGPGGWLLDQLVGEAHAHAGHTHFNGGQVVAEVLDPLTLRLGEQARAERVVGIRGQARSYVVVWSPDGEGVVARARGVARRGAEAVPFEGALTLSAAQRRVEGLAAAVAVERGGRLVLQVDAARWFAGADFTGMAGSMDRESQPMAAWQLNIRSSAGFALSQQE